MPAGNWIDPERKGFWATGGSGEGRREVRAHDIHHAAASVSNTGTVNVLFPQIIVTYPDGTKAESREKPDKVTERDQKRRAEAKLRRVDSGIPMSGGAR
jgi:hypothetical protein